MKGKIYNKETGKWISGGAAQLHTIKNGGGWDNFLEGIVTDVAEKTAKATVKEVFKEMDSRTKPQLTRVK